MEYVKMEILFMFGNNEDVDEEVLKNNVNELLMKSKKIGSFDITDCYIEE